MGEPTIERRQAGLFREKLSWFMAIVAAFGGAYVLLDPIFTITVFGQEVHIGGSGFSADLKGAVVSLILIGGWVAVKEYWLGASAPVGPKQGEASTPPEVPKP